MNPTDKLDLQMKEESDGSAVVIMPESELPQKEAADEKDSRLVESASDRDDDADDNGESDPDPEREAIRVARREERKLKKQIHREKAKESNHLINMLKKQNEQMSQRVAELEKRTAGADVARMDKAIEDAHLRLNYAKMKVAESTKAGDGNGVVEAQEAWYEARRNVESLEAMKKKASSSSTQSSVPQAPDPRLQRYAADWMSRNDWYDPNGRDTDSKIAVKIDEELVEEGWDPTSEDYWEELDGRLSKYLPHRYSKGEPSSPRSRPRSAVTSSGRESSSSSRPGEFRLSPDRVKAIKDAGKWDDQLERQKMIRRYAEYDRTIGLR
jgi:hypothetical protein